KEAQQTLFVNEGPAPTAEELEQQEAGAKKGNGNGNGSPAAAGEGAQPPTAALTDTPPVRPARIQGLELGPACEQCGGMMQRTGSCYTCSSCGNNTGCG